MKLWEAGDKAAQVLRKMDEDGLTVEESRLVLSQALNQLPKPVAKRKKKGDK